VEIEKGVAAVVILIHASGDIVLFNVLD